MRTAAMRTEKAQRAALAPAGFGFRKNILMKCVFLLSSITTILQVVMWQSQSMKIDAPSPDLTANVRVLADNRMKSMLPAGRIEGLQPETEQILTRAATRAANGSTLFKTCDLCSRRWLFVVSTGRSGSTTLMNMLNVVPYYRIDGIVLFLCSSMFARGRGIESAVRFAGMNCWTFLQICS